MKRMIGLVGLALVACDREDLPEEPRTLDDARALITEARPAIDKADRALKLLGILPSYECGEEQRTFVGRVVEGLRVEHECATIEASSHGVMDLVDITATDTCTLGQVTFTGAMQLAYVGGDDRLLVALDATETELASRIQYTECSDETVYRVTTTLEALTVRVELTQRASLFGGGLPSEGSIQISTPEHTLLVEFTEESPVHGTVLVSLDSEEPVTLIFPAL